MLKDPFAGFEQMSGILREGQGTLRAADDVLANRTGGTTLMGIVVQRLVEEAEQWQRPTRRFLLADKRPIETQRNDPWVEGDLHWLP